MNNSGKNKDEEILFGYIYSHITNVVMEEILEHIMMIKMKMKLLKLMMLMNNNMRRDQMKAKEKISLKIWKSICILFLSLL
jgi:hypothetical protein